MTVQLAVADIFGGSETRTPILPGPPTSPRWIPQLTAVVLTSSPAEVVAGLGGWIIDRTLAGCETTVFTPAAQDTRALDILGAKVMDCADIPDTVGWAGEFGVLAVSAQLYATAPQIRETVDTRRNGTAEDTYFWGELPGTEAGRELAVITAHRISRAGQAFKRHALPAAGVFDTRPGTDTELLWSSPGTGQVFAGQPGRIPTGQ